MLVRVHECVANQRSPDDRGNVLREIEATALIVEVVSPASARIALGLGVDQPLQRELSLVRPDLFTRLLMQANEASRQKTHALARVILVHSEQRAGIQRESTDPLLQHGP